MLINLATTNSVDRSSQQHYQQQLLGKMSKTNLYLKGLPGNFTDDDILHLAPNKHQVKSVRAAIEEDGKCKGYGFIDFISPEDARYGLLHIQQTFPSYTARYAKENEKDKTNLYVSNLPKTWSNKDSDKLKELFSKYGEIQSAFIMVEKFGNKPSGIGFVRFFNEDSAHAAIDDLEKNPTKVSDECEDILEAKFADKHSSSGHTSTYASNYRNNGTLNGDSRKPMPNQPMVTNYPYFPANTTMVTMSNNPSHNGLIGTQPIYHYSNHGNNNKLVSSNTVPLLQPTPLVMPTNPHKQIPIQNPNFIGHFVENANLNKPTQMHPHIAAMFPTNNYPSTLSPSALDALYMQHQMLLASTNPVFHPDQLYVSPAPVPAGYNHSHYNNNVSGTNNSSQESSAANSISSSSNGESNNNGNFVQQRTHYNGAITTANNIQLNNGPSSNSSNSNIDVLTVNGSTTIPSYFQPSSFSSSSSTASSNIYQYFPHSGPGTHFAEQLFVLPPNNGPHTVLLNYPQM